MMNIDNAVLRIRDKAICRNIELISDLMEAKKRLENAKTEKIIKYYQEEVVYLRESIKTNYDIIMTAADIERHMFYEN